MADPLWLPVTPSIRRLALAHLGLNPWPRGRFENVEHWAPIGPCYACAGRGRDSVGLCLTCEGRGEVARRVLPLHIPAGLAIARLRVTEIDREQHARILSMCDVPTAWAIRRTLLDHDPEMKEAPNARD